MTFFKQCVLVVLGFSSGLVISAGVFALITVLGTIPRMAQKTHTEHYVKLYETIILLGGVFGCILSMFKPEIHIPIFVIAVISLFTGVFFGALAVSLAETLDVFPIFTRRMHIQEGLFYFMFALAGGKLAGSLLYFVVPGFYKL